MCPKYCIYIYIYDFVVVYTLRNQTIGVTLLINLNNVTEVVINVDTI